ncbi:DUF1826 domain-containing protein [uncultured Roseobacter sp.]|uniref:DUF1826 domain-containing protein n=1 Tax=uncultured Roseobacter sp. TaxID=114847 RepID=UPI00262D5A19|nr:DUF1826 domain-containing protein [uncultured Roseobacter sp.]
MSFVRATVQDAAIGVAVADAPEDLKAFLKPGCAAAIWRRRHSADFQGWVNALDPSNLPQGRVVLVPDTVRSNMAELCEMSKTPSCPQRAQLINDVASLADIFADLMQTPYLRLRLAAVRTNACRKFHIDAITGRLVCTYRGIGTQYGISRNGQDPSRVFTVPTGSPILLRGTLWPEKPASGLLHRSPPIEGMGETRLVLVLDALSDLEEEA